MLVYSFLSAITLYAYIVYDWCLHWTRAVDRTYMGPFYEEADAQNGGIKQEEEMSMACSDYGGRGGYMAIDKS